MSVLRVVYVLIIQFLNIIFMHYANAFCRPAAPRILRPTPGPQRRKRPPGPCARQPLWLKLPACPALFDRPAHAPPAVVAQAFSLPGPFGRPPGRCGILAAADAFIFAGGVSYPAGVDLSAIGPAPPFLQVLQLQFLAAIACSAGIFGLFGRQLPLFCRGESSLPPAGVFSAVCRLSSAGIFRRHTFISCH